jgi:hypothetical protein
MAQHTATVSSKSDFKTVSGKMIISEFTLDTELTKAEEVEITDWVKNNAQIMTLTIDGKKLKFELSEAYNARGAYEKFFIQCGITSLQVQRNNETKVVSLEEFFTLFNL